MKVLRFPSAVCSSAALAALAILGAMSAVAQPIFRHPQPGEVYKENSRIMAKFAQYRVIDPNTPRADAQALLPNPVLSLTVDDLQGAVRAEAVIDFWGGHVGTTGKKIRFNGHSWIAIPELTTPPTSGQCYAQQPMVVVDVPLSHLVQGSNSFEGTNTGQSCYNFDWGMQGMFALMVRVYYSPSSKPHPTGSITFPTANGSFGENPAVSANASSSAGISRVDFIANYDGYDIDGDGIYKDWQYNYHFRQGDTEMKLYNHVGTDMAAPYSVTWNTDLVPDQPAGSIQILARIRDNNGVWFVTNPVSGLTLSRSGSSVKLYKAQSVPERTWVRDGRTTKSWHYTVPSGDDLSKATSSRILITTWNGIDGDAAAGKSRYYRVNSWTVPTAFGRDHFWSYDNLSMPTSAIQHGTNTFTVYSNSDVFGIEVLWPAPGILVRYSGSAPPPAVATKLAFGTQPANTQAGSTISPAVTVRIEDANGILVTTDTRNVSLAISANPAGGTLSGTATVAAVGGVATFSNLSINNAGTGYTLAASASGLTSATSGAFNITTVAPPPPPTGNLLANGGFENGTTGWRYYMNGGATNALSVVTSAPVAEGASKGRVILDAVIGTNNQLYYSNLPFDAGTQYRLTFQAYASKATTIQTRVIEQNDDYTVYGFPFQTFSLTTGWQTFTVDFTAQNFTGSVTDGMLQFQFTKSSPSTSIYFDAVTISSGSTPPPPPPPPAGNIVTNGGFEAGTTPWRYYHNGSGNSFGVVSTAPVSEGTQKARIVLGSTVGTNNQLYQTGLTLVAGTAYRMTFSAYASTASSLRVRVVEQDEDYTTYGFAYRTISLGTSFQTFTIDFTAANFAGTVNDAMLQFWFANSGASRSIYLDNIVIGAMTATDEVGAPTAEKSGEGLAPPEADVRAAVPTEIGLRQNYPNPFNPTTQIDFTLPEASHVTLEVYNVLGERVAVLVDEARSAGYFSARFDAATLPSGIYFYRLTTNSTSMLKKMMFVK